MAVVAFLQGSLKAKGADRIRRLQLVPCNLGVRLVFSLELMIISDVLHTVVSRSLDDRYFLGAIALIRTVIGFFLNREILELGAEMG